MSSTHKVTGTREAMDTVEQAATTPDVEQPWAELGLKEDEYARIREILGRRPTDAELAMYSVMWSEHCSYKSSKVHLKYFGETTTDEMRSTMLAGIGENAGVIDIGDGNAVTFKVESHNHPSYIEPYQGAATGVGGIVRDIMAMGARPVAVMDQLRFGAADAPDTRRVLALAVVVLVAGLGFKLSLVPFHAWTPEAYAGASVPVGGFLATTSKLAALGALLAVLDSGADACGLNFFPKSPRAISLDIARGLAARTEAGQAGRDEGATPGCRRSRSPWPSRARPGRCRSGA